MTNDQCSMTKGRSGRSRHWSFIGIWSLVIGQFHKACSLSSKPPGLEGVVGRVAPRAPRIGGEGSFLRKISDGTSKNWICCLLIHSGARGATRPTIGFPRASAVQCLILLVALILTACSPNSNSPDLHSRVFSGVEVIGARGTGLGQFTKPRSLALDRDDHLFVVDLTGRVQKFSSHGEILSSWRMPETDLGKPKGMCRDTNGNIVIVEPHYQRVNHFAPDGTLVEQWGAHGTNGGQLVLPRSVAVNQHGDIFVSEYTTVDRVQGFSAVGRKPIVLFGKPGTGDGEFNRAEGLDVDAQDRIYVADSCNHRIQIFSRDGKWLKTYGRAGTRSRRAELSLRCAGGSRRSAIRLRVRQQPHPGLRHEQRAARNHRRPRRAARPVQQPVGHRTRFARQLVRRGRGESSGAEVGAASDEATDRI
jgi:hypothetical protein